MLKKIIAAICLIAMLTIILTGCSFIVKNEQRDANQAIAVVKYGGRTAYVTKGELANLYNQQGYMYISYYGWTAEKTFEQLTKSLANSALLGLKAKDYLSTFAGITITHTTVGVEKPTTLELITEMKEMLTPKQIKEAVEATNTTFTDAYDDLVTEIEEEIALANGTDDEEEVVEEEEEVVEPRTQPPVVEDENAPVVIPEEFFVSKEAELLYVAGESDEVKIEKTNGREAIRRLKKSLTEQYLDYNYYFNNQLLSKVIDRYEEEYKSASVDVSEAEIVARYNEMLNLNIANFAVEGAYATALESDMNTIIYHPGYNVTEETGYFYVKNILLSFSDEQTALLKAFTDSNVANEAAIAAYRDYLATQILVNVSNIHYVADSEVTEEKDMYIRENVAVQTIIDEIEIDLNNAVTLADKIKVFVDWTYLVNDDPGMFTNLTEEKPDYLVTPEGEESSYVTEFTELARNLFKEGEGAYGLNDNELSYCVTDYGIHLIMVTAIPFNYAEKQGSNQIVVDDGKNILLLDAIINNTTGQTLREYIEETLIEEKGTNAVTNTNTDFYAANKDTAITNYPKVYKDLLKAATELETE